MAERERKKNGRPHKDPNAVTVADFIKKPPRGPTGHYVGYLRVPDKKPCHGCCYYSEWTNTCDFYLIENRRRPCAGNNANRTGSVNHCKCKATENRRRCMDTSAPVVQIAGDDEELIKRIEKEGKITNERNHEC